MVVAYPKRSASGAAAKEVFRRMVYLCAVRRPKALLVSTLFLLLATWSSPAVRAQTAKGNSSATQDDASRGGGLDALRRVVDKFDSDLRIERDLVYGKKGAGKLLGDLIAPKAGGKKPGVLLIHGGAWATGDKDQMDWIARMLAHQGFATFNINYRLAPTNPFPAQIEDCRQATEWMRENADKIAIDADWVASFGYSAGGQLALLLGLQDEEREHVAKKNQPVKLVQAVVAGGAPCDFRSIPPNFRGLVFVFGGSRAEKPDVYTAASPLAFVSADDPPVFFYHGQSDLLSPKSLSRETYERLKQLGVRTDFMELPQTGHVGAFLNAAPVEKSCDFLKACYKEHTEGRSKAKP